MIVLTSSKRFSLRGIEVGDTTAEALRKLSIGDPRLSTSTKATKRFLNAWKLG